MTTPTRIVKLTYYVTNKGLLVANAAMNYGTVRSTLQTTALINDKPLTPTFSNVWYLIEGETEITSYKEKKSDHNVLSHYILEDADMEIEGKIPFKLKPEDVEQYWDEDDEYNSWKNYSSIQSLYKPVYNKVIGGYEPVEFEVDCKGVVEGDINKPIDTTFRISKNVGWGNKEVKPVQLDKIVHYGELDQILTPEFAIHTKPCALTSQQTYDIIRTYVKDHIDPKHAIITSDYDFCFTVKKKVALKPWVKSTEIKKANGRSYRSPKFKTQTVDHKQVEIFEMTHEAKGYQGYTVIKGFVGTSLEDLVDTIKNYLQDLIEYINMPVAECQHCNGTGHLISKNFDMNKRGG
jgi:hypothetical protein